MKTITTWILTGALALTSLSCTTTYDAYGNPQQSVDPGTAVAGAAAVGILGYALANQRSDRYRYDGYNNYNSYGSYGSYGNGGYYDSYGGNQCY